MDLFSLSSPSQDFTTEEFQDLSGDGSGDIFNAVTTLSSSPSLSFPSLSVVPTNPRVFLDVPTVDTGALFSESDEKPFSTKNVDVNWTALANTSSMENETFANNTTIMTTDISQLERQLYLQQLQQETTLQMIPAMTFLIILAVVGIIGNALVLAVYSRKFQRTSTRIFIMSIAGFDLVTNVIVTPAEIFDMFYIWDFNQPIVCRIRLFFNAFTTMSAAMILLAVGVTRYRKICVPFGRQVSLKQAKITSVIIAGLGLLFAVPYGIINGRQTKPTPRPGIFGYECTIDDSYVNTIWPMVNSGFFLLLFFVNVIPLVVLYILIGIQAWKHSKQYGVTTAAAASSSYPNNTNSDSTNTGGGVSGSSNHDNDVKALQTTSGASEGSRVRGDVVGGDSGSSHVRKDDGSGDNGDGQRGNDVVGKGEDEKETKEDRDIANGGVSTSNNNKDVSVKMIRAPAGDRIHFNINMVQELTKKLKAVKNEREREEESERDFREERENEVEESKQSNGEEKESSKKQNYGVSTVVDAKDVALVTNADIDKSALKDNSTNPMNETTACREQEGAREEDRDAERIVATEQTEANMAGVSEGDDNGQSDAGRDTRHHELDSHVPINAGGETSDVANDVKAVSGTDQTPRRNEEKARQNQKVSFVTEVDDESSDDEKNVSQSNTKRKDSCYPVESEEQRKERIADEEEIRKQEEETDEEESLEPMSDFARSMQWVDITYCLNESKPEEKGTDCADEEEGLTKKDSFNKSRKVSRDNSFLQRHRKLRDALTDTLKRAKQNRKEKEADADVNANCSVAGEDVDNIRFNRKKSVVYIKCEPPTPKEPGEEAGNKLGHHTPKTAEASGSRKQSKVVRRKGLGRTTAMLIIISAVYIVGFLPFLILVSLKVTSPGTIESLSDVGLAIYFLFFRSYFLNSAANPIVYSLCDKNFRRECVNVMRCRSGKR
ncbi:uncharacterized protein LOC101846090 [Aplysia californica]|uniref:Uncharacterized protein LOC101846090 n=1 Tax=Aplysia californica TaxID=6500 RepID=A0ABM0K359_APLCA|nr:uncharacterized protein LOC101846090 [Aplysia californica]